MAGIFTSYNFFLDRIPDLEGQVAVVTVCLLVYLTHQLRGNDQNNPSGGSGRHR